MAKIIQHGKYWREEAKRAYGNVQVKCPECSSIITMSSYYVFVNVDEALCECGCKFIPEVSDIVKETV